VELIYIVMMLEGRGSVEGEKGRKKEREFV